MQYSEYNKSHCEIVESGIDSIMSYFESNGLEGKQSLLLCLDRYLDPYFGYNLKHETKIFEWLESEFYKATDTTLKEEIFDLIERFSDIEIQGYKFDDNGNFVKAEK